MDKEGRCCDVVVVEVGIFKVFVVDIVNPFADELSYCCFGGCVRVVVGEDGCMCRFTSVADDGCGVVRDGGVIGCDTGWASKGCMPPCGVDCHVLHKTNEVMLDGASSGNLVVVNANEEGH
jgi:hypothetical protein